MRRGYDENTLGNRVAKIGGALFLASLGALLLTQLKTLQRYLSIRRMSARKHPSPPGTLEPSSDAPPRWGTSHWPVH